MKIKMLQTRFGSEDGFAVRRFDKDKIHEIADSLGAYFIQNKCAIPAPDEDLEIGDCMDNLKLRIDYGNFLNETRSCLSFENWLQEVAGKNALPNH